MRHSRTVRWWCDAALRRRASGCPTSLRNPTSGLRSMSDGSHRDGTLQAAYESAAMVAGLGFLAVQCLIWLPLALVLHPLLPRRIGTRLGRLAISWGAR